MISQNLGGAAPNTPARDIRPLTPSFEELSKYYYRLALCRASDGNLTGAVDSLRVSLNIDPDNGQAKKLLALCLYERDGTEINDKAPDSPVDAFYEYNHTNIPLDLLRASTSQYNRRKAMSVLKALPHQSVNVLNIQGLLYATAGKYRKAARFFVLALNKDRYNKLALACLAEIYSGNKRRGQRVKPPRS